MPEREKRGFVSGAQSRPSFSAAPIRSKIPMAARKGNKDGRTLENQREKAPAAASVKAAGYRKRANMKKQTQMVSRRAIMKDHPLQCLLITVYVCFFDFMFLNYTIAMGVVKSLFGAR